MLLVVVLRAGLFLKCLFDAILLTNKSKLGILIIFFYWLLPSTILFLFVTLPICCWRSCIPTKIIWSQTVIIIAPGTGIGTCFLSHGPQCQMFSWPFCPAASAVRSSISSWATLRKKRTIIHLPCASYYILYLLYTWRKVVLISVCGFAMNEMGQCSQICVKTTHF